jgi:hypothetical protein
MRKSKLELPYIKKKVIRDIAAGKSQSEVAQEVELHPSQVCRFLKREDVQELIEKEALRLLEAVPDAIQNVKNLVHGMKSIPKKDTKRQELAYKATTDVLKSAGLLPSSKESQVLINIYQQNIQTVNPVLEELLKRHFQELQLHSDTDEDPEADFEEVFK